MDHLFATSPQSITGQHFLGAGYAPKNRHATELISFREFQKMIPAAIEEGRLLVKNGEFSYGSDDDPITKLFRRVNFSNHDWEPYAHFDPDRNYTRNLIATAHQSFTLPLLCWSPGKASPIHDYPCDGCWMKVCRGEVEEHRHKYPHGTSSNQTRAMECVHDEAYSEDDLAYISDSLGFHSVGNPSNRVPVVTMHLYVPPIEICSIWMTEDGPASNCRGTHYPEYGRILQR